MSTKGSNEGNRQPPDEACNQMNNPENSSSIENDPAARSDATKETYSQRNDLPSKAHFPVTDLSRGIIGWDSQDDPENPQNFSSSRKWELLALVSGMTFISTLASSILAPAVGFIAEDFDIVSKTVQSLTVSIYLLGYTVGPLILAPFSEIYGRRIVLSAANWLFVIWNIACAVAPNMASLIVFRLMAGMGGSGCMTLGPGVIADLFRPEKRGLATSLWSLGSLMGPMVGPVAGGFVGQNIGWPWVFWIVTMVGGIMSVGIEILNRETYAPVLLRLKTHHLTKELAREDLYSAYTKEQDRGRQPTLGRTISVGLGRPFLFYIKSPIVFLLATYLALQYALLYLFFTTIPTVYTDIYDFSVGLSGLAYTGIGAGFMLGLILSALTNDRIMMYMARRNGGKLEPEMRLPMMIFNAAFIPISFFWYGWSVANQNHWILPIIGMAFFGFGLIGVFVAIQTYVIDSYPEYASSATATLTVTRSVLGAVLPLAGPKLFETLGYGWGNSLLGFISVAFVPVPIAFTKYGKYLREKYIVEL